MTDSFNGYRIRFISGELNGRTFALRDTGTTIGRARSADIRPGGNDIAAEHITLLPQGISGVQLHVHGLETVSVNDEEVSCGKDILITPGADVRLGKELTFLLEPGPAPAGEIPAGLPADAEDDATDDATADGEAEAESDENHTRYASEAELSDLRKFSRREARRQKIVLVTGLILLVLMIGGAYAALELNTENPVTWPGEVSGNMDDGEVRTEIEPDGKCMVYFPKTPSMVVKTDGNNCEIMTALGRDMDVPFHLRFTVTKLPDGFRTTRAESFADWTRRVSEKENFSFSGEAKQEFFNPTEAGFPYHTATYQRRDKNFLWCGIVSYMRYQDKELVLLREVPERHFWRAEKVLRDYGAFVVSPVMVDHYWEIPETILRDNPTRMLQRVGREMRKNIAVAAWDDLDRMLRSLLCTAYETNDKVLIDAVMPLWQEFRGKQQVWYSQTCLAYQNFQNTENKDGMKMILNECLRRFKSPDDHRHVKIMKNIWTVE